MLYCITSKNSIKVGYTEDFITFGKRLKSYKTHNPDFTIIGLIEGTRLDEQEWHRKLRVTDTEWATNVDDSVINYFKNKSLINFSIIGKDLTTSLTNICVTHNHKIVKAKNKDIKEVRDEINSYLLSILDLTKDHYTGDELKVIVRDINSKWDLSLPQRPASIGKFIGLKKCSIRIPKMYKTKNVYRIVSKTPGYDYGRTCN